VDAGTHALSWFAPQEEGVCVCGIGARTPLGFTAAASAAAVRAAISAIAAQPHFVDKVGDPMALARDAAIDPNIEIGARIVQMVVSALGEALTEQFTSQDRRHMQCWVGLPEGRPGLPADIDVLVSSALSGVFGFAPSNIHIPTRGHAAGLMAIQLATQMVSSGETDFCVAAGVDSYHDIATLKWLDLKGRLMSSENRNGFPPSEAAGACLLARPSTAERFGLPILALVSAASTCVEPHSIRSTDVCLGIGLSTALKAVSSILHPPHEAITATYCDLNGERYRNEELLYALLRVQESFVDAHDYQSPADCWGDVGAASGPLFVCLATASRSRGYSKGLYSLLWAGSNSGHRCAILLKLSAS